MNNFMHKHRRLIMVFVFAFIGIPLAFLVPGAGSFGGGPQQIDVSYPVAQVGANPVTADEFMNAYISQANQRQQTGTPTTAADLVNDGTVEQVLDMLIQQKLITNQTAGSPVRPEEDYLVERLQDDPYFQDETGEFDKGFYNQWLQANIDRGISWDAHYNSLADSVNQKTYFDLIGASARVFESEVREEFERQHTTLKIKAAKIEPPIDLTDEDLQAHYDDNIEMYMTPEERRADFVAISLKAPRPPIVDELVNRARGGEDFEALVREYSDGLDKENGGDAGWIGETEFMPEHQRPLLDMAVGDVSDPIDGVIGIYIYKVEEERTDDAGERQVRARQIVIQPELSDEELQARKDQAQAVLRQAREEDGGLIVAASDEGLEILTTGLYSNRSTAIDNVPNVDVFPFRGAMLDATIHEIPEPIEGRENIYVGVVTAVFPPTQKTFEEARDDVERDATNLYKNGPEYIGRVTDYATRISEGPENLEAAKELFPELELEIIETETFGLNDFLFSQGLMFDTRQIFPYMLTLEPGEMVGPIRDFGRVANFIELIEKTPPTQEIWDSNWDAESADIREAVVASRRAGRQSDYLRNLTDDAISNSMIQKDWDAIFMLLGLDETATTTDTTPLPTIQDQLNVEIDPVEIGDDPVIIDLGAEEQ